LKRYESLKFISLNKKAHPKTNEFDNIVLGINEKDEKRLIKF